MTLSLVVLSYFSFTNSPWYYLTPYRNLLRLNVIFMVRKEVKSPWSDYPPPPSTLPLSNFRAKTVGPIWKAFHGQCPKDETTAKNFVWNKSSSYFQEKLERPVCGGHLPPPPPPPLGHRRKCLGMSLLKIRPNNILYQTLLVNSLSQANVP